MTMLKYSKKGKGGAPSYYQRAEIEGKGKEISDPGYQPRLLKRKVRSLLAVPYRGEKKKKRKVMAHLRQWKKGGPFFGARGGHPHVKKIPKTEGKGKKGKKPPTESDR